VPDDVEYGGTFRVWLYLKDGTLAVEFRGRVTCTMATADYATISGELIKVVVGDPCSAPPRYFAVTDGGYLVHADGL
jgi:hypothetical protein